MTRTYNGNSKKGWSKEAWRNESRFLAPFVGVVLRHVYPSLGLFSMVGAMEQCVNAT